MQDLCIFASNYILGDNMYEIIKNNSKIEDMIYEIRGKQVMLDSDLAKLYGCKNGTKEINQAVKNNIEKFPERFSFKMTDLELKELLVKSFDQKIEKRGGRYKNPRVFTEQGVAMLATILKSKIATEVSIQIMDAFVAMRKYIVSENNRLSNIETKIIEHDNKINEIFDKFDKKIDNHIFFEGQIYDAYSLLVDILKEAKEYVILIDNYIDKKILDVVSLLNIKVTIVTNNYNKNDVEKYKEQYDNIEIIHSIKFHDRFIILDYRTLYHCGASFKDLGKKCFAISKIENNKILNELLEEIYA